MSERRAHNKALLTAYRRSLVRQHEALTQYLERPELHAPIIEVVACLRGAPPPVLVVGLGKSGHVARKIAATLTFTGCAAIFVHATEALHGDLGLSPAGGVALLLSKSGRTEEVIQTARSLRARGCTCIALTTHRDSPLAAEVDLVVETGPLSEAEAVPTASTTLMQAIGDSLALAMMQLDPKPLRTLTDNHPGGTLGGALKHHTSPPGSPADTGHVPFRVVIPARYGSTRLPGKPLVDLGGLPMVERVRRCALASGAEEVWVATDDPRVADVVRSFGGEVLMTQRAHPSGTDRIAELVASRAWPDDTLVVNLQGDEPMMDPRLLRRVATALYKRPTTAVATAATPLQPDQLFNPNIVKLVTDAAGFALYFSRAPIPWDRERFPADAPQLGPGWLRHIGLYVYRAAYLREHVDLKPPALEQAEQLEQLRTLWAGHAIYVVQTDTTPEPGIDTLKDVERVRALLSAG